LSASYTSALLHFRTPALPIPILDIR